MRPVEIGRMDTPYGVGSIYRSAYQDNDAIAIVVADPVTHERYAVLSVNLPESQAALKPGEFFAKTWSENAQIAEMALATGLFEDTGRRVPTGYVEAQVWKLRDGEATS